MFDDSPDDGKIPEQLKKCPTEHDPCGMYDAAQFIKEKYFRDSCFVIIPIFQKKSFFSDHQDIVDKNKIQKSQQDADQRKDYGRPWMFGRKNINGS